MTSSDFVPDRRDEDETRERDTRSGTDRRRFLRPSPILKKKGIVFAGGVFVLICVVFGLLSL